jgi:pyruvate kinase
MNLPGIDLGTSAFTPYDHDCLKFALENGVDAVSQSFVQTADDVRTVREAARALGADPFIIAKIERSKAWEHIDSILQVTDGIMIARGDLGVEMPIEQIPVVQKQLMRKANLLGKPVITATHMLESMTQSRRPTRAEVTDVANAILDGTDCVMLSAESAVGRYPVDAVGMLAKIACTVEPYQAGSQFREVLDRSVSGPQVRPVDLVAVSVARSVTHVSPALVIVPTLSGASARNITRFRLPVWIAAVSVERTTCQRLQFSYGVEPVERQDEPEDWRGFSREWLSEHDLAGKLVILTGGPSDKHPSANNRMEILDLSRG